MRAIDLRKESSLQSKISQEAKLIHAAEKAVEPYWRDELSIGSGVNLMFLKSNVRARR